MAFKQAYSVSSTSNSIIGFTISSMTFIAILHISCSGWFREIIRSFPSNNASPYPIERRAQPNIRCSPAWARSRDTWSSSGRSQKTGKYLAHSTSTNSCCFIDSTISLLVASLPRSASIKQKSYFSDTQFCHNRVTKAIQLLFNFHISIQILNLKKHKNIVNVGSQF